MHKINHLTYPTPTFYFPPSISANSISNILPITQTRNLAIGHLVLLTLYEDFPPSVFFLLPLPPFLVRVVLVYVSLSCSAGVAVMLISLLLVFSFFYHSTIAPRKDHLKCECDHIIHLSQCPSDPYNVKDYRIISVHKTTFLQIKTLINARENSKEMIVKEMYMGAII